MNSQRKAPPPPTPPVMRSGNSPWLWTSLTFAIHHLPLSASQTCHHHHCFVITMTQTQGALFASRSEVDNTMPYCLKFAIHRITTGTYTEESPGYGYNLI